MVKRQRSYAYYAIQDITFTFASDFTIIDFNERVNALWNNVRHFTQMQSKMSGKKRK